MNGHDWFMNRKTYLVGLAALCLVTVMAITGCAGGASETPGTSSQESAAGDVGDAETPPSDSDETGSGEPEADQLTDLTLQASWLINYQSLGYIVAINQGFYEDRGLNVTIQPGGPDVNPVQVVVGGAADIGVNNAHSVISARAEGLPIRVVGAQYQKAPNVILCRSDSGAESFEDLADLRIAAGAKDRPIVEAALQLAGIETVEVRPTGADLAPIAAGQIDCRHGYASNEPVALENQGIPVTVFSLFDMGYEQQGNALFISESTEESQPEAIDKFVEASAEGWRWAFENPQEALTILADAYSGVDVDLQSQQLQIDQELIVTPYSEENGLLSLNPETWETTVQIMKDSEMIDASVTVDSLLVDDFLPASSGT